MLQSKDGSFYVGLTKDLQERMKRHNRGRGGKYTKEKRPFKLVYYEELNDLASAIRREKEIKDFSRLRKEKLIIGFINQHSPAEGE
jgi:putative endonuclease